MKREIILRNGKSTKFWIPVCLVFDSYSKLDEYLKKYFIFAGEIYEKTDENTEKFIEMIG